RSLTEVCCPPSKWSRMRPGKFVARTLIATPYEWQSLVAIRPAVRGRFAATRESQCFRTSNERTHNDPHATTGRSACSARQLVASIVVRWKRTVKRAGHATATCAAQVL